MGNLDFSANADQLKELATYMASQINVPTIGIGGGYAPIGSINFFDATTAPQDWLACDGTVYNIADYPQLADWYEAQHGSKNFYGGDGTTTFAVPNLQGEFLRGTGTNPHTNQGDGANVGVHQDGTIHSATSSASGQVRQINELTINDYRNNSDSYTVKGILYTSSGVATWDAGGIVYTSRPTNTSFLICVKAVVAGEVYSTEERVVGTWIDGKPLYQKTINCGTVPSGVLNGQKIYSWLNSNIESVFVKNLFSKGNSGTIVNVPSVNPYSNGIYGFGVSVVLDPNDNELKVLLYTGTDRSSFGYIWTTICYTKTTD